ncbi:MAG: recombination regulator RecX [Enterococcus sp.]
MITVQRISKGKGPFYQVDLTTGEKIQVSEDVLIKYRLLKGQELTEDSLAEIKKNSSYDFGLQQAMNYISYQLRSEKDVRTYLKEKEIHLEDRNNIVTRLKELDLINDQVYGDSFVRTQMRLSDKGPNYLAQQLKKKGLKEHVISQALTFYEEELQLEIATHTAEKTFNKTHGKSYKETINKVRQTLMKKGFTSETISNALEQATFEQDSDSEEDALTIQGEKLWRKNARFEPAKRRQKVKQSLYQKGFQLDAIQQFIELKEQEDD